MYTVNRESFAGLNFHGIHFAFCGAKPGDLYVTFRAKDSWEDFHTPLKAKKTAKVSLAQRNATSHAHAHSKPNSYIS